MVEIMNFVGIRHSYSYQQKTKAITQIVYVSNKVGSLGNAANSPMCSGWSADGNHAAKLWKPMEGLL